MADLGVSTQHHAVGEGNKSDGKDNEDRRLDALECPKASGWLVGDPLVVAMGGQASRGDALSAEGADPACRRHLVETDGVAVSSGRWADEAAREDPRASGRTAVAQAEGHALVIAAMKCGRM